MSYYLAAGPLDLAPARTSALPATATRIACLLLLGFALPARGAPAENSPQRTFDVRAHGARGDGQTLDTAAIQQAIVACGEAGGGRVLLPAGEYLSGTLRLQSGVELHLAEGARLVGTTELDAYGGFETEEGTPPLPQSRWHRGLIVGEHLHDIAFTGAGVIDGNKVFDPRGEEKMRGPHTILLGHCRGVSLRDLTLRDSANYAFFFLHSQEVRVENATFEGGWDGVHFRGSPDAWNRDVRITDCRFFTGDDSIAGHYLEDAAVENCTINSSCNGVRLIGPARRLSFSRCEFYGPGKFEHRTGGRTNMLAALCLQPSAWDKQPGPLEDVRASDLTMRNVSCAFHVVTRPGNTARRLTFERVRATGVYRAAASVESWGEPTFDDVVFREVELQYQGGGAAADAQPPVRRPGVDARKLPAWGFYLRGVQGLTLDRVRLTTQEPDQRPVLIADGVGRLRLHSLQYTSPPEGVAPLVLKDVRQVDRDDE
ncbi:MAG: right-handed parallel beta-helix repeat-containing protein [Pirellulales bacterium]|nr:right-handed parallel beta-helix repeat-containing protein [Pirellulales bacterium]